MRDEDSAFVFPHLRQGGILFMAQVAVFILPIVVPAML